MKMSYRSLDPEQDWYFFHTPDCPADCLPRIHPLTRESAVELWREYVWPRLELHPMELPADAWPARLISSAVAMGRPSTVFMRWDDDWDTYPSTAFSDWLRTALPWPDTVSVIFTWTPTLSVETSWDMFCRCWRNFLFEDEGPFLWSLERTEAVRFTPDGGAYVGKRA